ncbi:glyoxylate reductase [Pyrococcus horikoshii]|uniref:Glyoxylate reductase n=2 Tax=Pyrococcus horikoshii TaxID=53953 RepID=GYAR_PYRHO|nr:glyoxylate reductase [Pyrococcus horikoshii]O58320.2 RecName: Full=Glyoxylate reductase [Pyrococcus horikoshii OT3]2DBR_A Chain A, Glyoxylate reductase [Pyrococcus horikoshii OT3]2DBR_B Chain B, Glyoxylate reductase [Pyrococcus horikoshii OT3]2DBR_C Chain C, Glyoxylate reductase [Pyrococcus horikoshii OT3]2DBR_D Chain D, Glyoxylate reductase [Pyrococcus horikoshii OT3]2DBR_E Chain E, Glyoxylate reductase [Pyrococcus horikoshii OT3]2DBR_F Chain F, Glyoxylate reductase [Pyrococcus horikoshi
MKPKVFITREIPEVGIKMLEDEFEVEVWGDEKEIPREILLKKVKEVDALVTMLSERIDKEVFENAPKLRIVANYAVGYDNIDIEEATKRGIYVTNTPDVLTDATADLAFALLLATARHVVKGDRFVRSGEWKKRGVAWHPKWFLGYDVYGKTIGIIGLGRIGQAIAKRAKGFNMRILYYSRTRKEEVERELNAEFKPLEDLLRESDFVVLAVPLTRETYHLINEERLKLMKKTAILINIARGKVVDTNALVKALKEGWIAGAGLDVFEEEPYYNEELFKLDNVVLTPHIGSASFGAREGMAELVAKNLIAFKRGEIPPTLVNREVIKIRKPGFE